MSEQELGERGGIAFVIVLIIVLYFALVLFLTFSGSNLSDAIAETVIEHFTYIVVIIIVFYFGFRSVKEYMKSKGKQAKCEEEEKEPEQKQDTQSGACNNKGNMRENQDAGFTRIEQRMESASFSNYWYAGGNFSAAAGVAFLVFSLTLGSSKIMKYILLSFAVFLLIFGVCMIRYAHDMYPPKLSSDEKGLIYKNICHAIIIAICISVVITSFVYITNCLF